MITLHKIFKKWNCGRVGQGSGLKIHPCRFDSYWFHGLSSSLSGSPTAVGLSQGLITLQGVVINGGVTLPPFFKNFILPNFLRSTSPRLALIRMLAVVVPTVNFQALVNARWLALHERGVCEAPAGAMQLCRLTAQLPLTHQVLAFGR